MVIPRITPLDARTGKELEELSYGGFVPAVGDEVHLGKKVYLVRKVVYKAVTRNNISGDKCLEAFVYVAPSAWTLLERSDGPAPSR